MQTNIKQYINLDEFVKIRWVWIKWNLIFTSYTLVALFSAGRSILGYKYQDYEVDYGLIYSISFSDWYSWLVLTPFIMWFIHKYTLDNKSLIRKFLINLPACIVFTISYLLLVSISYELNSLIPDKPFSTTLIEHNYSFVTCLAIFGVIYAFDYYTKFRERELKASQLEARLVQAQFQVLKMQIHPHFLFNTLHAISTLIHKDEEAAERMIAQLGDLLRITMENAGEHEVPLMKELEFLKPYLEIEKTRFYDRLFVNMDIAPETLSAKVPNLVLQPLIENAIKHGIAPRSSGGRIDLTTKKDNGRLIIEISDDGIGLTGENRVKMKEGIGISNTKARLNLLYGDNHIFSIVNKSTGGVQVTIAIPFLQDSNFALLQFLQDTYCRFCRFFERKIA